MNGEFSDFFKVISKGCTYVYFFQLESYYFFDVLLYR